MALIFNIRDPCPHKRLDAIDPIPARARSWIARANSNCETVRNQAVKYGGAVFMIEGMEYHHNRFMQSFDGLASYYQDFNACLEESKKAQGEKSIRLRMTTSEEMERFKSCEHEAIAYLNRLGQFWYFARSMQLTHILPRIKDLMIFRRKFSAHRSIDMPQKEDHPALQERHGMSFGFGRISTGSFFVFQIFDHNGISQFHIRDDHPAVMNECMQLLLKIYSE